MTEVRGGCDLEGSEAHATHDATDYDLASGRRAAQCQCSVGKSVGAQAAGQVDPVRENGPTGSSMKFDAARPFVHRYTILMDNGEPMLKMHSTVGRSQRRPSIYPPIIKMSTHQLWCDCTRIVAVRTSNVMKVINEPPQVNLCWSSQRSGGRSSRQGVQEGVRQFNALAIYSFKPILHMQNFSVVCPRTAAHSNSQCLHSRDRGLTYYHQGMIPITSLLP